MGFEDKALILSIIIIGFNAFLLAMLITPDLSTTNDPIKNQLIDYFGNAPSGLKVWDTNKIDNSNLQVESAKKSDKSSISTLSDVFGSFISSIIGFDILGGIGFLVKSFIFLIVGYAFVMSFAQFPAPLIMAISLPLILVQLIGLIYFALYFIGQFRGRG